MLVFDSIIPPFSLQRTEVVDDASWVNGLLDIIDPALDSIKRLLNLEQDPFGKIPNSSEVNDNDEETAEVKNAKSRSGFDLDAFIKEKLSLDPTKLDDQMETSLLSIAKSKEQRTSFRPRQRFN